MLRHSGRRLFAALKIKSKDEYEALKLSQRALVGFFHAKHSTASKMLEPKFQDLATSAGSGNAGTTYFTCDVDDAPDVAYDMEVEDVPSVGVLPLGSKPDGTLYGKEDLVTVKAIDFVKADGSAKDLDYNKVLSEGKAALDKIGADLALEDKTAGKRRPWRFDPNTGTTLPPLEEPVVQH